MTATKERPILFSAPSADRNTGRAGDPLDVPWHECSRGLRGPMVGIASAHWNHRANPGDRLVCCACGDGIVGTDEQVAQAAAADAAHEAAR